MVQVMLHACKEDFMQDLLRGGNNNYVYQVLLSNPRFYGQSHP